LNNRAEFLQKFLAQAIKAAVGHEEEEIARFGFGPKMLGNGVGTGKHAGVFAERTDTFRNGLGVQAILAGQLLGAKNAAQNDAVAEGKRVMVKADVNTEYGAVRPVLDRASKAKLKGVQLAAEELKGK